jgi:UDP-N-acetylmuramoylalanine--D-glutamate ligase
MSLIRAIEALPNIGAIFLGGLNRGYDFSSLAEAIKKYKIPNAVFFPESGETILKACAEAGVRFTHILKTSDMAEAVRFAYAHSEPGTVCLLSTASPSYTLWKNFEEKGDRFQHYVRKFGKTYDRSEITRMATPI